MASISESRPTKITVVGFSQLRARLLTAALATVRPDAFSFTIFEAPLDSIDVDVIRGSCVLAASDATRQDSLKASQRLRTDHFHWEPIHFLVRTPPRQRALGDDWAIYFQSSPPQLESLAGVLVENASVSPARRSDIVRASLVSLGDDVGELSKSLDSKRPLRPERLRQALREAGDALEASAMHDSHQSLIAKLQRLWEEPVIEHRDIQELLQTVIAVEMTVRKDGREEHLATRLHMLNNILRLAAMHSEKPEGVTRRISARLSNLENFGLESVNEKHRTRLQEMCSMLRSILQELDRAANPAEFSGKLNEWLERFHLLTLPHVAPRVHINQEAVVQRILVAEDDADWRRLIVGVLRNITSNLDIQEAGTISEAEELLKDPRPALALVDLGLPLEADSEPVLDAGLGLIRRFSDSDNRGRRFLHRFIVLTAAQNYSEAVHEALGYGISPANYLQKDPLNWENELRAQVRIALQPPKDRLPTIEIFKHTPRIVHVERLEIKLELPTWCLLSALASSRPRGRWNEPERLASVMYFNYGVAPDARSEIADSMDPTERILNQLPHYSSELNLRLADAYLKAVHEPLPLSVVSCDQELGYRLNANARVLDRVDEYMWRRPRVLVVEDNAEWGTQITKELSQFGFEVRWARCTDEAREMIDTSEPDLISLDLELPTANEEREMGEANAAAAVEFLSFLRETHLHYPVAILTSIPWQDQVMLDILRKGVRVDDYVSKNGENPIRRLANSLARLWQESLAKTRILDWDAQLPLHPIKIEDVGPDEKRLTEVAGFEFEPAGKGLTILKILSASPNVFVSRAEIIDVLYGDEEEEPDNPDKALNSHIKRLRQTITDATEGSVPGDEVICGDRGIYWLRGLVQ